MSTLQSDQRRAASTERDFEPVLEQMSQLEEREERRLPWCGGRVGRGGTSRLDATAETG